uniref:DUF3504 domain-containing protein n=1 Tax=Echinostoma caproni TaxID=27848 RepID=A0A183A3N6_9TREM
LPKYTDAQLPAREDNMDRCPVRLFELFCARRPASACSLNTPFYLQPERSPHLAGKTNTDQTVTWFTANALGKNRIGALLNAALQSMGMPVRRQVNLIRFCDVLAAAALTPAGGEAGTRLVELMSDTQMNATVLDRELTACAECIVDEACRHQSVLHDMLVRACESSGTLGVLSGRNSGGFEFRPARPVEHLAPVKFVPIRPVSDCSRTIANRVSMSSDVSQSDGSVTRPTTLFVPK